MPVPKVERLQSLEADMAFVQSLTFKLQLEAALRALGPAQVRPEYRSLWSVENPTLGFCYVISEYLHHRLGKVSTPKILPTPQGNHRYLHLPNGEYLDLARDADYNYEEGRTQAFMTPQLSKRGQQLKVLIEGQFS